VELISVIAEELGDWVPIDTPPIFALYILFPFGSHKPAPDAG
jgi:hypothetical protein